MAGIARQLDRVQLLPDRDARLRGVERRGLLGQRMLTALGSLGLLPRQALAKVRGRLARQGQCTAPGVHGALCATMR